MKIAKYLDMRANFTKSCRFTLKLIRGIFTTTLEVNYNQILMLVFM